MKPYIEMSTEELSAELEKLMSFTGAIIINGGCSTYRGIQKDPEETAAPAEATKEPAPRETEKPTAAETPETAPVTAFPAAEQAGNAEMPAVLMHPENRSESEPDETAPESPDGTGAEEGAAE